MYKNIITGIIIPVIIFYLDIYTPPLIRSGVYYILLYLNFSLPKRERNLNMYRLYNIPKGIIIPFGM